MMSKISRLLLPVLVLMLIVGLSGCQAMYFLMPPMPKKKIPAEFAGLENHSVAVVIYTDPGAEFEHRFIRLDFSAAITNELVNNIKSCRVLDPRRVVRAQDENLDWDALDKTEFGKKLGVDYVLYVSLTNFTTHEPGSEYLYKGDLDADVSLYDVTKPERLARVWSTSSMKATYPSQAVAVENDIIIYQRTVLLFADKLAKKFYKYEEDAKE